jgi:hypothetical protein
MPITRFDSPTRCGWCSEHTAALHLRGRFSIFLLSGAPLGRTQVGRSFTQEGRVVQSPWRTWRTWRGNLSNDEFRVTNVEWWKLDENLTADKRPPALRSFGAASKMDADGKRSSTQRHKGKCHNRERGEICERKLNFSHGGHRAHRGAGADGERWIGGCGGRNLAAKAVKERKKHPDGGPSRGNMMAIWWALCFAPQKVWNILAASFMHWMAPSEKDAANGALEKCLWRTPGLLLPRLLSGWVDFQPARNNYAEKDLC